MSERESKHSTVRKLSKTEARTNLTIRKPTHKVLFCETFVLSDAICSFINEAITFVESRATTNLFVENPLFVDQVKAWRRSLEDGEFTKFGTDIDPAVVAQVFKLYLTCLPNSIVPEQESKRLMTTSEQGISVEQVKRDLESLPRRTKELLAQILFFFRKLIGNDNGVTEDFIFTTFNRPIIRCDSKPESVKRDIFFYLMRYCEDIFQCEPGESIATSIDDVDVVSRITFDAEDYYNAEPKIQGTLYITNYRILWQANITTGSIGPAQEDFFEISIPLRRVASVKKIPKVKKKREATVILHCKDLCAIVFGFSGNSVSETLFHAVSTALLPKDQKDIFAVNYKMEFQRNFDGWKSDMNSEISRLGLNMVEWRQTKLNATYSLCFSYSYPLLVPTSIGDDILTSASKARHQGRVPLHTWTHPGNKATLFRAGEPIENAEKFRKADQHILDSIPSKNGRVKIVNTGIFHPWHQTAYPQMQFIHVPMSSLTDVKEFKLKLDAAVKSTADSQNTGTMNELMIKPWMDCLKTILTGANNVIEMLEGGDSVMIQEDNSNFDASFQIVTLALLLLDPYYRTLDGFAVLFERELRAFGFPFSQRLGNTVKKVEEQLLAPTFTQLIDLMWQLWIQFPTQFEWNEDFLIFLLDESYNCKFGTFLSSTASTKELRETTVSIWSYVHFFKLKFTNPHYEGMKEKVLVPTTQLTLWKGYYYRWEQTINYWSRHLEKLTFSTRDFNLKELDLKLKHLSIVPSEVSHLTHLTDLNLSSNNLNLMPTQLFNLKNLKIISLKKNQMAVINEDFFALLAGNLFQLEELILSENQISVLPSSLGMISSLVNLEISSCNLTRIPSSISNLKKLEKLNLSRNRIAKFPANIQLEKLTLLDLHHNKLSSVPKRSQEFPNLKILRFSHNSISEDVGTIDIPTLTDLDLSKLTPSHVATLNVEKLVNLKMLKLVANQLEELPVGIDKLTALVELHLENNQLKTLAPEICTLRNLEVLHMKKNHISSLKSEISNMVSLKELKVGGNFIESLPATIGHMITLVSLDISENRLDSLPATIASLPLLKNFQCDKNPFKQIPQVILRKQSMMDYLMDLLKGSQESFRGRTLIVGPSRTGKTSLWSSLVGRKRTLTGSSSSSQLPFGPNAVNVEKWNVPITITSPEGVKKDHNCSISVWDFEIEVTDAAYAEAFQRFFISGRNVVIIPWNLTTAKDDKMKSQLDPWLHYLAAKGLEVPIFLVGTSADDPSLSKEFISYTMTRLERNLRFKFPQLDLYFHTVSCVTDEGMPKLKADLEEISLSQRYMVESIPNYVFHLEKQLNQQINGAVLSQQPSVVYKAQLVSMGDACSLKTHRELLRALRMLADLGELVVYESNLALHDLTVFSPVWMAGALSAFSKIPSQGVINLEQLSEVWQAPYYPQHTHALLLSVLSALDLAFPLHADRGRIVVPSQLPETPDLDSIGWSLSTKKKQLGRIFKLQFVPNGIFGRIIYYLLPFAIKYKMWRNSLWMQCQHRREEIEILVQLEVEKLQLELTVRSVQVEIIPSELLEAIETLIQNFYQIPLKILIPCPHCNNQGAKNQHNFAFEELEALAIQGKRHIRCTNTDISVRIALDQIVPDLTMREFLSNRIDYDDLTVGSQIGEGSAAKVYKGTLDNFQVAIKELLLDEQTEAPRLVTPENETDSQSKSSVFTEFRREVAIMSKLQHPNLVNLKGLCITPRLCIVTEFLAGGNLYKFIHDDTKQLPWPLIVKIANDVASGMAYLHAATPPCVHRDLKSPNVLLNPTNSQTIAKVSDFGLSGAMRTVSNLEVANPRWLAPEVMASGQFSTASDVYSFGVILYELLSRTDLFADIDFNSVVEDKILAGERPPLPESDEPLFLQLITTCWAQGKFSS
eukprot:TRINITY_DN1729_c1_g1_i4.p1 TRINITY_DN1729_c1_g1~~TRINITY_DN1729_c1_g1_i4.p1  ORF type:complete len:1884 (+),score=634.81 TRINITY_DN1729_c1_g1_i4:134-5785(+)